MRTLALLLGALAFPAFAEDVDDIRATLKAFEVASRKGDASELRRFFAPDVDYRDNGVVKSGIDSVVAVFFGEGRVWSETTPPALRENTIKMLDARTAMVDAEIVQYGSMILKASLPVVLVVEKRDGTWKISYWRSFSTPLRLIPAGM